MFVVIIRDISERQRIDRMKDDMLSAVSHEMRTPLTVIIGFIDFMLDNDVDGEQRRQYHKIIGKESKRLKEMIDNLLTLQRLRAGDGVENFQPVAIWPLLQQTVNLFNLVPDKHQICIDCPSGLPPMRGHDEELQQAMENLLSNAIKYSPDGGTVTLAARIENGVAVLSVKDDGNGIPAEDLDEIFDRFFRIDTSDKKRMGATGLGLPLVKAIAKAHGGRVWVKSSLGHGSTFFLTIPIEDSGKGT
jgi:signal transduction histidine kinase